MVGYSHFHKGKMAYIGKYLQPNVTQLTIIKVNDTNNGTTLI